MTLRKLAIASAIAAVIGAPSMALADSDLNVGPSGTTAQAQLSFRITIPDFVYFQVGTASAGTIDRVDFDMTGLEAGDGNAVAPTGGTGDAADGIVTVVLRTNAANVEIDATGGDLTGTVSGTTIPFSEITASDGGVIPVPDFDGTTNLGSGPIDLTDNWTFSYDNTSVYQPDQYDGTVTYTVTTL